MKRLFHKKLKQPTRLTLAPDIHTVFIHYDDFSIDKEKYLISDMPPDCFLRPFSHFIHAPQLDDLSVFLFCSYIAAQSLSFSIEKRGNMLLLTLDHQAIPKKFTQEEIKKLLKELSKQNNLHDYLELFQNAIAVTQEEKGGPLKPARSNQ